jgi:hypothetical protein
MVYSADVVRSNTAEAVEVLADSVLNPKFNSWEVDEQVAKLKGDLKKFGSNHQNLITEVRFPFDILSLSLAIQSPILPSVYSRKQPTVDSP